jgi:hypothetical protein
MTGARAFFKGQKMTIFLAFMSRYGIWIVGFALAGALVVGVRHMVYMEGYNARDAECRETNLLRDQADRDAQDAAEADAQRIEMLQAQVAMDQALILAQKQRKREIQYIEVTKWRTKYAQNPNAGKCVVPDEFVRVLDATGQNSGDMSEAAGATDGADAGVGRVSDIELLQYSTDAKMMCLKWRDQLLSWQAWTRGVHE